ncbi:acyl-homoserine-lactone synthase [Salmonella enterica]|nr:acyl-homoserine-lactone synthase [Salmonella enterica]EDC8053002.1 acyl-homoserine-lactone synthase [Salmonella enterica subsp. enterica serovar Muenchen]EAW3718792.1 acyl-homoserine-lactone synthase [Salmonella enterica]EAX8010791.1 acyl-homoserine-lactone synthase [Salmonella enterica]EAY7312660.1 acyl-homoserine-lactone synthase [Salmonella enterica]
MFEFFDVSYDELVSARSDELYRLRKRTFSDRLKWDVTCSSDMEFDEFDKSGTCYILGIYDGYVICSVRFVDLNQPNMINRTFSSCFRKTPLPPMGTESSRFFVDKKRAVQLPGKYPVSQALFLSMINWALKHGHDGIHTIVSRPMLTILKRTGWKITVIKEAFLNEREQIYLVYLPTGVQDQNHMASQLAASIGVMALEWPMVLPVQVMPAQCSSE